MKLVGARGQQQQDFLYDYSGSITTGGTAQLCLPQRKSCSFLSIQNTSNSNLFIQLGLRPATATISSGAVTSVAVVDAGFGFQFPPNIFFFGGALNFPGALPGPNLGATMPGWPAPNAAAQAYAAMATSSISGQSISSIVVTNGGSGYTVAPYVFIQPLYGDPTAAGLPSASATVGILLGGGGGAMTWNASAVPTDAVAIVGATTGQTFTVKWMD
jgi:hypothetical protein